MIKYGATFPFLWVQFCASWPCLRNKKGLSVWEQEHWYIHISLSQWDNLLTVQKHTSFNAKLASAITKGQCSHSLLSHLHQLIMCTYLDLMIERCIFMFVLLMVYLYTKSSNCSSICFRSHVLWLTAWTLSMSQYVLYNRQQLWFKIFLVWPEKSTEACLEHLEKDNYCLFKSEHFN